jgi:hypothetical protein
MLRLFLQSRPPVDVCLSCNWCWRCRSVKSIWHSSNQFWAQSKQFQTLSSLENGSDSKCSHTHKKFQTLSSLESWSDSKCITLTNNSKPNPFWRLGGIPSRPHWRTFPVWETGSDSKYTTLTIKAIWTIKLWPLGLENTNKATTFLKKH